MHKDLTGIGFGKLTAIREVGKADGEPEAWECVCDCGEVVNVRAESLIYAKSVQCKKCRYKNRTNGRQTHGQSHTRLYGTWCCMRRRCHDEKQDSYPRYGGRGITICEEWKSDFAAFQKWAMENGFVDGLEIDRIDNDGNYCPSNCRWATHKEQANNRRTSHIVDVNGEHMTVAQAAEATMLV